MKKIISLLLVGIIMVSFAACGKGKDTAEKERKRATAGQNTTTLTTPNTDQVVLDTGMLSALDKTYAKSNKAGIVYDPNVFLKLAQTKSDAVKIAIAGDEIAYGNTASNVDKTSYPAKLQQMLNSEYGKGKFEVTNYATSSQSYVADFERADAGSLRYQYTDQYRKMRKDKPDVVILMVGTNDVAYLTDGERCEEYKKAYVDLIKDIKKMSSTPLVFVCTPIVRYTALSTSITMEVLRNATITAANEADAYVIDTYNITKEYFSSALFETDGKHPNDAGYKELAEVVMAGITKGYVEYKQGKLKNTSDYVVYVSSTGKYDSVGASPKNPTSSFARAVELCQGGGTIVVCGSVNPTDAAGGATLPAILPENYNKITVTSVWDGVDYRNDAKLNAKIFLGSSIYLNGDFEFTNVTFETVAAATKVVCNYNDVTFGKGFNTVNNTGGFSLLIVGNDVVTRWQTHEMLSCTKDCNIKVNSGTFTYLRGGNYKAYSTNESQLAYGTIKSGVTVNITIDGATFNRGDVAGNLGGSGSTLTSVIGQNGMEEGAVVNFNVLSGSFIGSIYAVPRMNPYPASGVPAIKGTINMTLKDGRFNGQEIKYLQTFKDEKDVDGNVVAEYIRPKITGKFNLVINSNTFTSSANKVISGSGCSNAKITMGEKFPESLFTIKGFKNYK